MQAFWGMLTLLFRYQSRIFPFVAAVALARRLPGPTFKAFFMARAMDFQSSWVLLGIVGADLAAIGRVMEIAAWKGPPGWLHGAW